MLLSVFTPSHDTRYLTEAYESLAAQTHEDWEWVVLLNGRARQWTPPSDDSRVKIHHAPPGVKGVGALKRAAVELCAGQVLVELDHDDLLTSGCLAELDKVFGADADAALAYSDFAQVNADRTPNFNRFNPESGWVYTPQEVDGVEYDRCHAMAPTPHNVGYIWFAPNHVRAFTRTAYDAVGGYDPALAVLDDQELMMRLFQYGEFVHIDQLLYLQRVHGKNTQSDPTTNAGIQTQTVTLYRERISGIAQAWSARHGLRAVRLLPQVWFGPATEPGLEDVLIDGASPAIPLEDGSVGVLVAMDVLQKVSDRAALLNEAYRVLAPGGLFLTLTPSTDGRGAFQDPSHVSFWNENSFMYLTQSVLAPSIPGLTARFQVSHLNTHFPSPGHESMQISYVQANLIAVKDGPRNGGPLLC